MTATVRFEPHDLRAIQMARRALVLFGDAIEESGGHRGAAVGLALDDLTLLIERMEDAQGGVKDDVVIPLDSWSRRA